MKKGPWSQELHSSIVRELTMNYRTQQLIPNHWEDVSNRLMLAFKSIVSNIKKK